MTMHVSITIRDVPDTSAMSLRRAPRAARAGQSLQEYLRVKLIRSTERHPVADVIVRARARVQTTGVRVDVESILGARDADRR